MPHRPTCVVTLTLVGLTLGCGTDASSTPAPGSSAPSSPATAEIPTSADSPPSAVQLTWLPGGGLALENAGDTAVSLARALTVQAREGTEPTRLQLGLDCPSTGLPPTVAPAQARAADCITLVPGAALALGRWPDDHGSCRCPPCVVPAQDSSFVIHICDEGGALSRSLPAR